MLLSCYPLDRNRLPCHAAFKINNRSEVQPPHIQSYPGSIQNLLEKLIFYPIGIAIACDCCWSHSAYGNPATSLALFFRKICADATTWYLHPKSELPQCNALQPRGSYSRAHVVLQTPETFPKSRQNSGNGKRYRERTQPLNYQTNKTRGNVT